MVVAGAAVAAIAAVAAVLAGRPRIDPGRAVAADQSATAMRAAAAWAM